MKVEEIDLKIAELEKLKNMLLEGIHENDSLDTIIFKKYLELENVAQIASWLNELGYRIKSSSTDNMIKYNSNDITARIIDKHADVRADIKETVQKLFKQHKKGVMKRWG